MSCSLCGKFGEAAGYCQAASCPRTGHHSNSSFSSYIPVPKSGGSRNSSGSKPSGSGLGASIAFLIGAGTIYNYRYEILYTMASVACVTAAYFGLKHIYKKAGLERPRTQAFSTISSIGLVTAGLISLNNNMGYPERTMIPMDWESFERNLVERNLVARRIAQEERRELQIKISNYVDGPQFYFIAQDSKMNDEENRNLGYLVTKGSCVSVSSIVDEEMFEHNARPIIAIDGELTVEGYLWQGGLIPAGVSMSSSDCHASILAHN